MNNCLSGTMSLGANLLSIFVPSYFLTVTTCITLQLIDGQPIEKIADITGKPRNTVKSHLFRGKEKLTTYLKQNGYERR